MRKPSIKLSINDLRKLIKEEVKLKENFDFDPDQMHTFVADFVTELMLEFKLHPSTKEVLVGEILNAISKVLD